MFMRKAVQRDRNAAADERRDSEQAPTDCVRVSRRSYRLRRALVALAITTALPAAFATTQAAAFATSQNVAFATSEEVALVGECWFEGKKYSQGSRVQMVDGVRECQNGGWV
jgi:hypothetical protein